MLNLTWTKGHEHLKHHNNKIPFQSIRLAKINKSFLSFFWGGIYSIFIVHQGIHDKHRSPSLATHLLSFSGWATSVGNSKFSPRDQDQEGKEKKKGRSHVTILLYLYLKSNTWRHRTLTCTWQSHAGDVGLC